MTKKTRRTIGAVLLVLGAVMLALAPETIGGLVLIALAIALEATGIYLEHKK
jgi:membrane-bound ClpP family serine protease